MNFDHHGFIFSKKNSANHGKNKNFKIEDSILVFSSIAIIFVLVSISQIHVSAATSIQAPNGTLFGPSGVAVDSTGKVYVLDRVNSRVEVFNNSTGAYVSQFSSFGTGLGQINSATGITVTNLGRIYVADTGNNRIERFNLTGTFKATFGSYGQDPDGPGPLQAPAGTFFKPLGITTDNSHNIYVVDSGNNRVEEFSSAGVFIKQIGSYGLDPDGPGPLQAPNGTLNYPRGVAVDSSGNVYVADTNNNRVEEFNSTGAFKKQIGSYGIDPDGPGPLQAPDGTLNNPGGVAVDSSGNVYVADSGNDRVEVFDSTGAFKKQIGTHGIDPDGTGPLQAPDGTLNNPSGVAIDSLGNVYVADTDNNRVEEFDSTGAFVKQIGKFGASPNAPQPLPPPAGIGLAKDSSGNLYIAYSAGNNYEKFNSSGLFVSKVGVFGTDPDGPGPLQAPNGAFKTPNGIKTDFLGNVFVVDSGNNRVEEFSSAGAFIKQIGSYGLDPDGPGPLQAPNGTLNNPAGVTVDISGNVYVTDSANNRVEVFDSTGAFKKQIGLFGQDPDGPGPLQAPDGTLNTPSGVSVDSSGNVYVVDSGNNRVEVFDSTGAFEKQIGSSTNLNGPEGISLDSLGNVYVADTGNNRIAVFDSTGAFVKQIGTSTSLNTPSGVALDGSGNVFVSDSGNMRIQKFDNSGRLLSVIGVLNLGGTVSGNFASGVTVTTTLPTSVLGALTLTNTTASTNTGNSNTKFNLLQVTDISPSKSASCTLGCVVTFQVNQTILNNAGLNSQNLKIYHDLNNDNDFKDSGEQLNTTITQGPVGTFTATATTYSNSKFALGNSVTTSMFATLNETVTMADQVTGVTHANPQQFSVTANETVTVADQATASKTHINQQFFVTANETLTAADQTTTRVTLNETSFSLQSPNGLVTYNVSPGVFSSFSIISQSSILPPPPNGTYPYSFFSWSVVNFAPSSSITMTITFPNAVPAGSQYLKLVNGSWISVPITISGNKVTMSITDNGPYDNDPAVGTISDPGGLLVPPPPPPSPSSTIHGGNDVTIYQAPSIASLTYSQLSNGKEVGFGGKLLSSKSSTAIFETGNTERLSLLLEEDSGSYTIQHVGLYTNIPQNSHGIDDGDTHIIYDKLYGNEIVDPHKFFSKVDISTTPVSSTTLMVNFDVTFAKEMPTSDVLLRVWNMYRAGYELRIPNALAIHSAPASAPNAAVNPATTETPSSILSGIKDDVNGMTTAKTLDSNFVKDIHSLIANGIIKTNNKGTTGSQEIPHWVTNIATWWANGQISDDEFVQGLQWLEDNQIINVQ